MAEGWDEEQAWVDIITVGDDLEDSREVSDGTAVFERVEAADLKSVRI